MVEGSTPSASASGPWNTVDALLYTWLARPRAEREQLLDKLGAGDPTLAAALGARLEVLQRVGLDQPDLAGPVPGSTFGPYRIRERIGAGGMGAVYLAEQVELGRRVALKVIRPDRLADASARERFRREARAVAGLRHRGICAVYDVGAVDDTPYLAMQYVEGRTLAQTLADRRARASTAPGSGTAVPSTPREIVETLRTVEAVAEALHTAHEAGVVHRDVKPGNILIDTDGQPVLLDFGLAQDQGPMATDPTLTGSGDLVGTPAYMSPEQIRPRGRVDRRTDVYSLGVTLYECLTLERPFRATDQLTLCEQIERDPTPDPRRSNPHLPVDLSAVLAKAMEKSPARRYATALEFAAELRRVQDRQPVLARRIGWPDRCLRWSQRNPTAAALVVVLALGMATTGLLLRAAMASEEVAKAKTAAAEFATARATEQAAANAKLAEEKSALAAAEAEAKGQFDQLSGVVQCEDALAAEADLYPGWPQKIPAMDAWLATTDLLLAKDRVIRDTVASLRDRALPVTSEQLEADRRAHARYAEYERLANQVASLRRAEAIRRGEATPTATLSAEQQALDAGVLNQMAWGRVAPDPTERAIWGEEPLGLAAARAAVAKFPGANFLDTLAWALWANGQDDEARRTMVEALAAASAPTRTTFEASQRDLEAAIVQRQELLAVAERRLIDLGDELRTWRFGTSQEAKAAEFLHDALADLLPKLEQLQTTRTGVAQRRDWAQRIEMLTHAHPNARHTWTELRAAIANSEKYAGATIELRDEDVLGLVPIGENPATGLWEFYHLRSAWDEESDPAAITIPEHRPDGSIEVTGGTGIVFVLLPGGTFTMGAQPDDPHGPNHDPQAMPDETPHAVTLSPFFLARHELTRGQWERLAGTRPFWWNEGEHYVGDRIAIGPTHPATSVDWNEADLWLGRHGMELPTEAQWEYGCRAGTSTPWWPGPAAVDVQGCANVHDRTAYAQTTHYGEPLPFTDGFTSIAPVGSFRPNAFGLYDVHGNVYEWCRDSPGNSGSERSGDGLLSGGSTASRAIRGGNCLCPPSLTRSANRDYNSPSTRLSLLGLRPARSLTR